MIVGGSGLGRTFIVASLFKMSVTLRVCRIQVVLQPSLALVCSRCLTCCYLQRRRQHLSFTHYQSPSMVLHFRRALHPIVQSLQVEDFPIRSARNSCHFTPHEHNNIFRPRKQWIWFQVSIMWNEIAARVGVRLLHEQWSCDFRQSCVPTRSGRIAQHFSFPNLFGVTPSIAPRLSEFFKHPFVLQIFTKSSSTVHHIANC